MHRSVEGGLWREVGRMPREGIRAVEGGCYVCMGLPCGVGRMPREASCSFALEHAQRLI